MMMNRFAAAFGNRFAKRTARFGSHDDRLL